MSIDRAPLPGDDEDRTTADIPAAVVDDVPYLRAIVMQAVSASPTFIARMGAATIEKNEDAYWSAWTTDPAFVAMDAGVPVGAIMMKPDAAGEPVEVWRIFGVGVDARAQGHGVGRALIERALARATELRARAVSLLVDPGNAVAIRLYQRTGFVVSGDRHGMIEMRAVPSTSPRTLKRDW